MRGAASYARSHRPRGRRAVIRRDRARVKTVEWNLSKIYRKVGVRSRTELIARHLNKPGESSG
jgi:hypothetical protein